MGRLRLVGWYCCCSEASGMLTSSMRSLAGANPTGASNTCRIANRACLQSRRQVSVHVDSPADSPDDGTATESRVQLFLNPHVDSASLTVP